eukprot:m51a1_g5907 hypothetical protein (318) ;mRNA; f:602788-603741
MPKYVLTGADGHLGSVAADYALELAQPGDHLVFTSYTLDAIPAQTVARWRSAGADVVAATYDDPATLVPVFAGAEAVAFVSTWLLGERRRRQASNVIAAAQAAGVRRLCYTSFVGAGSAAATDAEMPFLPRDHRYVERALRASGLQWCVQRNYLYADNIPALAASWRYCGDRWLANAHGQRGAYVAREDCGRVLGALLMGRGEAGRVYVVTGPAAVTQQEVFEWICAESGYRGRYVDMPDDEMRSWWLERGLPVEADGDFSGMPLRLCVDDLMCSGEMIAIGSMLETTDTVERLTGRKPLPFQKALLRYKDSFPAPN